MVKVLSILVASLRLVGGLVPGWLFIAKAQPDSLAPLAFRVQHPAAALISWSSKSRSQRTTFSKPYLFPSYCGLPFRHGYFCALHKSIMKIARDVTTHLFKYVRTVDIRFNREYSQPRLLVSCGHCCVWSVGSVTLIILDRIERITRRSSFELHIPLLECDVPLSNLTPPCSFSIIISLPQTNSV